MRRLVEFIDTCVLVEILNIPERASQHQEVIDELARKEAAGMTLVLPTAAVIEAGNFVCQIKDGQQRRSATERYVELLRRSAAGETPWVLHKATWNGAILTAICDGAGTGTTLVEHSVNQTIGVGDLSILAERNIYRSTVAQSVVAVGVWTTDGKLRSWVGH